MTSFEYSSLVSRYAPKPRKDLTFLTDLSKLQGLFTQDSLQPQNTKQLMYQPNDIYIQPKQYKKKPTQQKQIVLIGKAQQKKQTQERKKHYKPGPFANFYQLNQGHLDKDKQVWYYKEHKDVIGPVSSYNMDKLVYYKQINDQTKVAYQSVEKFKKFGKIKKYIEEETHKQEQ